MDLPVNVPVDNPDADTEWNDILRKHKIIPEKPPSPTPVIEEAIQEAIRRAHDERLEHKDLDELGELEDDEDAEFLDRYRQQRMAELSTVSRASVYNQVYPVQKPDYAREVTEESQKAFVLVNLTSSFETNVESRKLSELWRHAARTFGDVKFCEMRADMCIEGYPDRNTPTILVYRNGDIQKQVVTLRELGGVRISMQDLQRLLLEVGAVAEKDHRLLKPRSGSDEDKSNDRLKSGPSARVDEDDDDWD